MRKISLDLSLLAKAVVLISMAALVVESRAQENRVWELLGPKVITSGSVSGIDDGEVVGAANSVAPHPSNANILFVGGVNGGVWRTTNATTANPVWVDVSEDLPSRSIGCVSYDVGDPTFQTILVGAGRYSSFARRGGLRFGLYRSTNGGDDWVEIDGAVLDGQSINAIAANGNLILVSTGGSVSGQGLFLGENSGGVWTWTQLSGRVPPGEPDPILPSGRTFEVVADPTSAGRYYTLNQSGVYQVTLAADPEDEAWTRVSTPTMDAALASASHGRLAIGPGGEVFVAMSTSGTVLSNFWRSPDGSTGWTVLDTPISNGFGNWFLALAADPNDGDVAYVGGGGGSSNYRVDSSLASGSQGTRISGLAGTASNSRPHADVRDLRFDANDDLIEADDGGVYKQTNPTDATGNWLSLNGNLSITEIHNVSWDGVSHVAMGGLQDNGTAIQNDFVRDRWLRINGNDGGDTAINDTGSAIQSQRYLSSQNFSGFQRRTFDQDNNQTSSNAAPMTPAMGSAAVSGSFTTPFAVNVVSPLRVVVGGTNGIFESSDQGQTAVQLEDGTGTPVPGVNAGGSSDPIAAGADGNSDALYVGRNDDVWVRTAGGFGGDLTQTDPSGTRNNSIIDVVIDPGDDQTAFAIDSGAVFWTSNAGGAWTDITQSLGALTTATFRSIAYSTASANGAVIVGTDNGVFISRGNGSAGPIPFDAWTALGLSLPPAPVFDLEFDVADEVLIAGTLGRGAWALNMEERDPIDVALVLDKSGSMGGLAAPGGETKMVVLQDAAELFIQTWQMLSDSDDRIAAVFFDSTVENFSVGSDDLVSLTGSGDDVVAYIRGKTNGGATAMGGGTQTAINLLLPDNSNPRSIILFTDGMQNRDPEIVLNSGVYEIANTGGAGSGVSPTVPPTQLNTALDIVVNTIGIGVSGAYDAELAAISSGTTGLHKSTTNADADLRRFYIEELVDVLRDASPQLIDYGYSNTGGGTNALSYHINAGAKKVVFAVSWKRKDGRLKVAISKDGKEITQLAKVRRGDFYSVFSFDTSAALLADADGSELASDGKWNVQVAGPDKMDYEVAVLADDSLIDYAIEATPNVLKAGGTTTLAGEVELNGLPLGDNVSVRVEIECPQISLATALSLTPTPQEIKPTDGETLAEAKLRTLLLDREFLKSLAPIRKAIKLKRTSAGRFNALYSDTTVAGVYKASFLIEGDGLRTGPFERREQYFFVVAPGPFVKGSTPIKTVKVVTVGRSTATTIHILPQDLHGNFLGADQSDKISVAAVGTGETGKVANAGNGWYELVLITAKPNPTIEISIDGDVVARGKAKVIDVDERSRIVTGRPTDGRQSR